MKRDAAAKSEVSVRSRNHMAKGSLSLQYRNQPPVRVHGEDWRDWILKAQVRNPYFTPLSPG